jgi:hypothetical protein
LQKIQGQGTYETLHDFLQLRYQHPLGVGRSFTPPGAFMTHNGVDVTFLKVRRLQDGPEGVSKRMENDLRTQPETSLNAGKITAELGAEFSVAVRSHLRKQMSFPGSASLLQKVEQTMRNKP